MEDSQPIALERLPSVAIVSLPCRGNEAEVKKSQQALKNIADETGGRMMLPLDSQEMLAQANEVARAIGAEYVVTYRPKRPLADAQPGEYRRIEVASRRVGVSLQSRRGYVVPLPN